MSRLAGSLVAAGISKSYGAEVVLADVSLVVPPRAEISFATAWVPSALRSVTATWAPSAANTSAVARPMPLAAPVTRTVRPFTERLSSLKSDMDLARGRG